MLSPRSLALSLTVGLMLSLHTVEARSRTSGNKQLKVQWKKPADGDAFVSGETITAEWTSRKAVISPSVSLCTSQVNDGNNGSDCGELVWPKVTQEGKQSSFSLAVPEVASDSKFYLRMKDDFGNTVKSPAFSLHPGGGSETSSLADDGSSSVSVTSEGEDQDGSRGVSTSDEGSSAQAPLHGLAGHRDRQSGSAPASGPATSVTGDVVSEKPSASQSHSIPVASSGGSHAEIESSANAPHGTTQMHGNPLTTGAISTPPAEKSNPYNTVNSSSDGGPFPVQGAVLSRAGLPTAAIAVPVSLVGATIIASIGLCFVHRRSLAAQRARNAHLIDLQRNASIRSTTESLKAPSISRKGTSVIGDPDIEKAIDALYGYDANRTQSLSQHGDLRREDSGCYIPNAPRYPIPRRDIRRERAEMEMYDRTYEWPSSRCRNYGRAVDRTRTPPHYSRPHHPLSLRPGYRPPSSFRDSSRSLRSYRGETGKARSYRYDHDDRSRDEDDGASSTETILSNYVSPLIDSPRSGRYDPYSVQPRFPPRPHPRPSDPETSYHHHRHYNDRCNATTFP